MKSPNLPAKTHEEAVKLKQAVYAFVPQQYHGTIEFSFQIFDTEDILLIIIQFNRYIFI